jgi:hypothetical protein
MARAVKGIIFIAIVCGVLVGVFGCGGAAPVSPSTTSANAAGAEAVQALSDYKIAIQTWGETYAAAFGDEGEEALKFQDPTQPTDGEIRRARQFADAMRASVTDLEAISAPAEIAKAHSQLCSALCGELNALDRFINAVEWGSVRDAELAYRGAEEAYALWERAINGLSRYVELPAALLN